MTQDVPNNSELLAEAIKVVEAEVSALSGLTRELGDSFCDAIGHMWNCQGRVVVTGMGKSGLVGQKISATLASTGTPSHYMHAAEAAHGDMGRITDADVVLALSNSGESEEIVRLLRPLKSIGAPLIAMTGDVESTLARQADVVLGIGDIAEACPMGLVPTASTTAMMVLGDALAMTLFSCRGLGPEEYARFHPGGSLGRKLMRVEEIMRHNEQNPVVKETDTLRSVISVMTRTAGAASVVDGTGKLTGFFTDGDLRRLLEQPSFSADVAIKDVMRRDPKTASPDQLVVETARVLRENKIDQLPVVDKDGVPVGLIDVQDLLVTRIV
jgi:arabinose-5-phosphate isomerase